MGHITSVLAPCKLEVEPLLIVPGLVCGFKPVDSRDNIDRQCVKQATGFASLERPRKQQQSGSFPPLGSPPGPHSGVTPKK